MRIAFDIITIEKVNCGMKWSSRRLSELIFLSVNEHGFIKKRHFEITDRLMDLF